MNITIKPSVASGEINAPPSKSCAHRLLICAALANGKSVIENIGTNDDIVATISCLKELGAKKIYSTANRQIEEKFLLRSGADCIIYPERDICRRISSVECAKHIFDYINIADDYSIFEIEPHKKWLGKTVMELNFRNRYKLNIIAYKKQGKVIPLFNADYTFNSGEHLLVLGNRDELNKILK
jgi:trk system potassium uptake protein TrkA